MKCANPNCTRYAKGDEFCSTNCAKIMNGVISPEQAKENKRIYRKLQRLEEPRVIDKSDVIYHKNLPRHEGPQIRQRIRFRG